MQGKFVLVVPALILLLGVGMLVWSVPAGAAPQNTQLYVDDTLGSDSTTCSGPGSAACKTIGKAYSIALTGSAAVSTTINIAAGTYAERLTLDKYIVLQGPSGGTASIDGTSLSTSAPLITVNLAKRVSFNNLTIQNGTNTGGNGGGILIAQNSSVSIRNSRIMNNTAAAGGGIYNQNGGSLFITRSSINNNAGGGIWSDVNTDTSIDTSAIVSNTTSAGITDKGALVLVNSTVGGNDTGGINVTGSTTATVGLYNVTVYANTGTGVAVTGGAMNLQNSIVALNSVTQCTASGGGTITSHGYNRIGSGACGSASAGDSIGDPLLTALALNGGFTMNYYPQSASPVIDKGNPAGCLDNMGALLTSDQRGSVRPQGAACDIGSDEFGDAPALTSLNPDTAVAGSPGFSLIITGAGFKGNCRVFWGTALLAGPTCTATQVTVPVPATLLTTPGTVNVTVENYPFNSGNVSGPVPFTITPSSTTTYTIDLPELFK